MATTPWYGKEIFHYNFDGNETLGKHNLYSSDNPTGSSFTKTYMTKDGESFYNYKLKQTYTANDWPNIQFPTYAITAGKKYQISLKIRINKCSITRSGAAAHPGFGMRHARITNDYYGCPIVELFHDENIGKGWFEYSAIQQIDSSFTYSGTTHTVNNPHIELYSGNLNGCTYDVDFDIKDVMVVETNEIIPYIAPNSQLNSILDISGNGRDGNTTNVTITKDSNIGNYSAVFSSNSYISRSSMFSNVASNKPFTLSCWFKCNNFSHVNTLFCDRSSVGGCFTIFIMNNNSFRVDTTAQTSISYNMSTNTWYHLVASFTGTVMNFYMNGKLVKSYSASTTTCGNTTSIGASQANGSGYGNFMEGNISDIQLLNYAMTAESVEHLYHSRLRIMKTGELYTYMMNESSGNSSLKREVFKPNMSGNSSSLNEDTSITRVKIYDTAAIKASDIQSDYAEFTDTNITGNLSARSLGLKDGCASNVTQITANIYGNTYDSHIYVEPDGSEWIRLFHHNNPASVRFSSNDPFTSGHFKTDNDRWFSMGTCSNYSKWELMIKQKSASNSSEQKFRWTQPANPFTCSYADIHGKVVHNTNTGYTNYNYGGLFRKNSSTFLATDNNTNGSNWFGAVGSWAEYGGGIPAYPSGSITTGYLDVYLRVDNVDLPVSSVSSSKDAVSFIDSVINERLGK